MFNVTDANGKSISFTLEQLQDINHIFFDAAPHKVSSTVDASNLEVLVVDEDGKEIGKVGDVSNITDSDGGTPKALLVDIEVTHSGDNHNYAIYHSDSMEKDAQSFIHPYNKPLIKNHNASSEPLGRAKDFLFKESSICPERDTIQASIKVTDKEAIEKFLDGRYNTVSIGANVGHIKCNICGKDILKDKKVKFCGHFRGQKYGDNVALWHLRDLTYNEVSVVNSPADDWAQVVKVTVLKENKEDNSKDNVDNDNTENDNLFNEMDNLLGKNNDECITNDKSVNNHDENNDEENNNSDDSNNEDTELTTDELQELLNEANTLKDELQVKLDEANSKIELLEQENLNYENNEKELSSKLNDAETSSTEYKNMCIKLSNLNKTFLIDSISLLDKDVNLEELKSLSIKELNSKMEQLKNNNSGISNIPKVTNPSIVNLNDKNSIIENEQNDDSPNTKSKKNHINSIIENLYK